MNKEAAEDCVERAVSYLSEGKIEKAEKLLAKSLSLHPLKRAEELLEKIKCGAYTKKATSGNTSDDGVRQRPTAGQGGKADSATEAEYTTEQLEAVKRIKKCKDYYEVLGVTKDAPDTEIKKAYKKLALQLHPDKNKAPGAVEAFKAIGNAVAILTDSEKRKSYDLYGSEEQHQPATRRTRTQYEYAYSRGFETEFTAEELFNMFFGGNIPTQHVYMRQRRFHRAEHQQQYREPQSGYAAFINLLPIILLIGLSMMSSFFISDPIYSLTPSQKFSVARKTNQLKIPYYVKDNFHSEYQGSVGRLEASVEEEYLNNLKHSCYRERNYKETMLMKARNFGDRDLYLKAQNINTPSCDKLNSLHN
ncbi:dnaJ homolog subfamily B member 14 [Topomyia yanbarensis]|uniref:dnaJ homolog subfamily B member 14 n=1 Tax=Topomyia yanbarensis TaxID=2498891 RepID=UPI00273B06E7|nr:dnaJ homolog subfamily B member 14 [Topomyia yanbarensis]